jgi:MFS superfamily sulfate permease-like transporter
MKPFHEHAMNPDNGGNIPAPAIAGKAGLVSFFKKRLAPFNRGELSGSLGDMGTFIPLLLGMTVTNGLDFASSLLFAGIYNIITGFSFGIPMAVQPMKAIAAIAISQGLPPQQIFAAGICTGAVILFLGVTRLIDWFNKIVPLPVVRGLQLGLGLSLIMKGAQMVQSTNVWWGVDGMATGLAGFVFVIIFTRSEKTPTALILFSFGLLAAIYSNTKVLASLELGIYTPSFVHLSVDDFKSGFFNIALAQIPLTTLNSVIAVCALSADLFPQNPAKPRSVSVSVGMMNLIGCWFGAMPMCHGAGGLAGQYRFGARSHASIVFLGSVKIALALFFGGSLLALTRVYPVSILGVLLAISGIELALSARDQADRESATITLVTAGATLAFSNTALGFVIGWSLSLLAKKWPSA